MALVGLAAVVLPGTSAEASNRKTVAVEAVRKAQPSVVSISSEKKAASSSRWPFSSEESQQPRVSGMGTGVILDQRGYILTNHHVVDKVQAIEVHLSDGTVLPARLVQHDPVMDLAMLKVESPTPLPAITVGTSADLMVGEDVVTIGNAFGYENTVSVGIISALGRNVKLTDDQVYRNLIQTDACINPGNSGGPLVNVDGELIGINVAVRAGAQGIGFALPIDDVKKVAAEMLSTKRLANTWHGLILRETPPGEPRGVAVIEVPRGSPAEAAGIKPGDQILKVNDLGIANALDVERGFIDVKPGQPAKVSFRRASKDQQASLIPVALARQPSNVAVTADTGETIWSLIGLRLTHVDTEYVSSASSKLRGGLYIQSVQPGSPAQRAMLQPGDILVGMNVGTRHWETVQPENVVYILKQQELLVNQTLQFYIVRRNGIHQGALTLADRPQGTVMK
ncbi:trypsin-like peptidase domain-containing protein [Isosphaeraceae bacterium EP7]